jgi:hypothetical protein
MKLGGSPRKHQQEGGKREKAEAMLAVAAIVGRKTQ